MLRTFLHHQRQFFLDCLLELGLVQPTDTRPIYTGWNHVGQSASDLLEGLLLDKGASSGAVESKATKPSRKSQK